MGCIRERGARQRRKKKEAKKEADERWGGRVEENFGGNRNMLWKEVKRVRKENG